MLLLLVSQSVLRDAAQRLVECSRVSPTIVVVVAVVVVVIALGIIAHLRAVSVGIVQSTGGAGIAVETFHGDVVLIVCTCSGVASMHEHNT